MTTQYKVALAQFPGGGVSRMETNAWVVRTVRKMDKDERVSEVVSLTYADTPITMMRNRAVVEARQEGCHYLLMIDSDMCPDLPLHGARPFWDAAWEFLMQRRREEVAALDHAYEYGQDSHPGGIEALIPEIEAEPRFRPATVAAPYCGPSPNHCCYVFEWVSMMSGKPDQDYQLQMIPRESAAIRSGIHEVAALPTGLILYDMRVFDILPPPWYCYEWSDVAQSVKATTEDVYQTRNASLLGLPQFVAWDSWSGHIKSENVPKPTIVTRDMVHDSLRKAVLRGIDSDDRLIMLRNGGDQGLHEVQNDKNTA